MVRQIIAPLADTSGRGFAAPASAFRAVRMWPLPPHSYDFVLLRAGRCKRVVVALLSVREHPPQALVRRFSPKWSDPQSAEGRAHHWSPNQLTGDKSRSDDVTG